jgi:hypothetical protein
MATPNFSAATKPGNVNNKLLVYMGLESSDGQRISATAQGTYLLTDASGTIDRGSNTLTVQGYDISHQFTMSVSGDIPHVLYGNQTDQYGRYDPAYNLTNPSGDLKTWVCDAKKFMTAATDNAQFTADYKFLFNSLTNGINVYVGSPGALSGTAVNPSTYTWYPDTGTVVFNSNQAANAIISIDGVPLAMAPELMIKHLFVDFGQWSSSYLTLQTSNTLLPVYTGGRNASVWQCASDIAKMTAPRLVPWQIRANEAGYIRFYENKASSISVETLIDERDLFNIQWTESTQNIANVWKATATANSGQQLVSLAVGVSSIRDRGQRAIQDIPSNILFPVSGMNPGTGISFLNSQTAARLAQSSEPTLELSCDLLPNFLRQVGDRVTIIEQNNGLSGPYIYKGITNSIGQGGAIKQSARFQKALIGANYNLGIPSAVSSAFVTQAGTPPTVNGTTNIVQSLAINGTAVMLNGTMLKDNFGNPILPVVTPTQTWTFSLVPFTNQNYDTVLFHYLYMECPNSLNTTDLMAVRLSNFGDGSVIPAATIAAGTTITATHTTGTAVNVSGGEYGYQYSGIVVMASPSYVPTGYNAIYTTLTNTSTASAYLGNTTQYGVAYGPAITPGAWWPNHKQTYAYLVLQLANAAGAVSVLRVPFIVSM